MNITESQLRAIVREMLTEAAATPPTSTMFDINKGRSIETKTSQDVFERLRKAAAQMTREFTPYMVSDKVVTEKNATTDQSIAMNNYLLWYAIATGRSDRTPWSSLGIGTSWPTEALAQFQKEQAFSLTDGRLGKQTASYILSGGKIRRAPPGMKLEDADKIAKGILEGEKILAAAGFKVGSDEYVANPPQQMLRLKDPTPVELKNMMTRPRGPSRIERKADDLEPAMDARFRTALPGPSSMGPGTPRLSSRGDMSKYGGAAAAEFEMPRVRKP